MGVAGGRCRRCSMRGSLPARPRTGRRSDALRGELAALGVAVEDTKDGQRWRLTGGTDGPA